jgi:tetratricopeptide (TPR) repeat protein
MRARLLLLAGALAAFGGSLGSGFHFDDYAIFSDPVIRSSPGLWHLFDLWQTRPLTYLTFWLNYQAGGQSGFGYHAVNLLLHLAAALLAYECLGRLLPERTALMAAALFAIHPIQAEAVNYVWARSILLAAVFCFASLLAWIQDRPWASVAWFAAALLAKEECAAFPLCLLALAWGGALPRPLRSRTAATLTMLTLAVAAGARVIYATAVVPGAPAGPRAGISPGNYWLAQSVVILRYLRLLAVPYGFTVDPDVKVTLWLGIAGWIAILGLAAYVWRARKTGREACPTWFIAGLILLIPSSSIFPAADLSADRRMYLPMLAFAAAGALLLARVKTQWMPAALAPALLSGALLVLSFQRTLVWMREESLWREAVQRAPDKVRPKIQLARAVPAAKALELLSDARRLAPYNPAVAAETGKILLSEGQPEAALQEFGRALALDPRDARNLNNRGVALEALWQTEAARQDFQRALEIDPNLTEARENLGKISPPAR